MIWKFCDKKGKLTDKDYNGLQVDKVGNILQHSGAIKTKACQNCGTTFTLKSVRDEVKQAMDKYSCNDCDFESYLSHDAVIHTMKEKKHTVDIEESSRIVGYRNTLSGAAIIEKIKDDYSILCKSCNDVS